MTRSPRIPTRKCDIILGDRKADHPGTRWDHKALGTQGLPLVDLRYKAGEMTVVYGWTVRAVAAHLGMSVGWVQKWKTVFAARYWRNREHHDVTNVVFRSLSNRPRACGCPVRDSIRRSVGELRARYPFLGSCKMKRILDLDVSTTTIDRTLRELGMMGGPRTRSRDKTYGRFERRNSVDMVQIDYKKWADGVYSIWVLDDCSRFIMGHRVEATTSADDVIGLLERTFTFWGLWPRQILSDHGSEFFSVRGGKGASRLDAWCREHGIEHITGRVNHPQTQGKIERSHGSAKREMGAFGPTSRLEEARESIAEWIEFYNTERPHQALDYRTPLEHFMARLTEDDLGLFLDGPVRTDASTVGQHGCPTCQRPCV